MIRNLELGVALTLTGAVSASAQSQAAAPTQTDKQQGLSAEDKRFLRYAAEDNQAEIGICLLAEKRAQSNAVKAFARLMVDDHVQIESRLAALGPRPRRN